MKSTLRSTLTVAGVALAMTAAGCSSMSEREKSTAIGAGAGGVAGSVLTDGGTLGTLGGAAVGGVIGNEVGKRREREDR